MSEDNVSMTERVGIILLTATVGATVTVLLAHPRIESALNAAWRDGGGDPAAVTFKAQEAYIHSGNTTADGLANLPVTVIHPAE